MPTVLRGIVLIGALVVPASLAAQRDAPLRARDRFRIVIDTTAPLLATISEAGDAVIPLAGPVRVAGLSPLDAVARIRQVLAEVTVQRDIDVIPLRRVVVSGEVARTDVLFVENGTSIAEAVVLAGGFTAAADKRRVDVWRDGAKQARHDLKVAPATTAILQSGDEVVVQRAMWVTRNANVILTVATSLASILAVVATAR